MPHRAYQDFQKNIAELTRLAAAQIEVGIAEADESVNLLTNSFTDIINQDRKLRDLINTLPEDPEVLPIKESIALQSSALGNNVRNSIIAFQFFDRMCQRMEHSIKCLKELSTIEESNFQEHLDEITRLKHLIYESYTMAEERELFDAILSENDFDKAIEAYLNHKNDKTIDDDDDIELF